MRATQTSENFLLQIWEDKFGKWLSDLKKKKDNNRMVIYLLILIIHIIFIIFF